MFGRVHQKTGHGIRPICKALEAPCSSWHHATEPTSRQKSDAELGEVVEGIFKRHRRRYGHNRIHFDLSDKRSIACIAAQLRRIMLQRGLRAIQPKTYVQ